MGKQYAMRNPMRTAALTTGRIWICGAVLLGAVVAGCTTDWERRGHTCVREGDGELLQRVINYTDPELCERPVKETSDDYVRVEPA